MSDRLLGLHIGGTEVPAASGVTYATTDPATGSPWARVADAGVADVEVAVAARAALVDRVLAGARRAAERGG